MKVSKLAAFVAAAATLVALSGCASNSDAGNGEEATGPLRVSAYGSSWTEAVKATAAKKFTEETGVEVVYVEGNPSDVAAQVYATAAQGAEPPIDVITTDDQTQTQLAERDLLVPVEEYIDSAPGLFDNVPTPATNEGYAPSHCDWYLTLTYNKDKFAELGLPTPTSWDDLFAPELAGHVSVPDISTAMAWAMLVGLSEGEGYSHAIDRLAELDTYSVYSSSSEMQSDVANGNVWAAATMDGRGWALADEEPSIEAVHVAVSGSDKIGPRAGGCYLDVVKDSPRVDLAAKFIAAQYDDDVQVAFGDMTGYLPSSPTAVELLIQQDPIWTDRIPNPENSVGIDWQDLVPQIPDLIDEFNRKMG